MPREVHQSPSKLSSTSFPRSKNYDTPKSNNFIRHQGGSTKSFVKAAGQQEHQRRPLLGQRPAPFTGPADTYDYTQIYEEDEPYTEMSPNARVWKVYNQEVTRIDSGRIEDWRDGLDSLLVFASLFSAVITTVASQTSTRLQKDWGEVTSNLIMELIAVQRAALSGNPVNAIPSSQLTSPSGFTPRPLDVAINALWFFSLALSLSTALAAIVCKQWIHQYTIMPSTNSPQERAHVHHFRFMGIEKWHVAGIVGLLPIFVHLSLLGVFFGGLVIFLHDLSPIVGGIVDLVITLTIMSYITRPFRDSSLLTLAG
ncbi:hypothetical protein K435DRAFT_751165 [Dendrothele bispora CBS 962.96]|uniref:DUF6535 domain-containing protein n=1 Tax=Dendrothele bispora (strain CBS 962.96) TaxID=1314807 RepID=A0A4S8MEH0_DENBC|nr:hypothetical protein K435DRAFT_751165 [Dendrothele bispora CBS 962.96]